jgi:hypothetical protein
MHVHMGILHSVVIFASVIVWGFFWRVLAAHNAGNALGQGMSFIY